MTQGPILAIADAEPSAGRGHVARVSAVVVALRTRGIAARCLALGVDRAFVIDGVAWEPADASKARSEATESQAILLDSYHFDADALPVQGTLACFCDSSDSGGRHADLLIAPALGTAGRHGWLCGFEYACLRPGYWGVLPIEPSKRVKRILVTVGGFDTGGVTKSLVTAALRGAPGAAVRCVRGPYAPALGISEVVELPTQGDLRAELRAADLVLCLGGQTALEAACLGLPTLAVAAVANQRPNVAHLANVGAVQGAALSDDLPSVLAALAGDPERRVALGRAARSAVDGFGALRVAAALQELLEG